MEYPLGECKSCDALADQIAKLTKTNLAQAAQIDELNSVIGHAKQMEAMDKKTLAEQAAQVGMLITAAVRVVRPFIHAKQGSPIQILREALSTHTVPSTSRLCCESAGAMCCCL
jgi:cobalamin biosynthesis protein CbiG